jgi:spore maturation protein CgeB
VEVIVIGQFGIEDFGIHIKEGLEELGHTVTKCIPYYTEYKQKQRLSLKMRIIRISENSLIYGNKSIRKKILSRIMDEVKSVKTDLIICTGDYFLDYEINEIKKCTRAKIAMWYPDHIMNFGRSFFMTAQYDALFFKDPYIVKNLRKIYSKNAYYLPECFSKTRHAPVDYNSEDEKKYRCDIAMIGNLHSFRVPLLEMINDFDLKIYGTEGPWWLNTDRLINNYTGNFLAYQDKAKGIKYAKISLNTLYFGEIEGVNVRTFEIAGTGGFQMVQYKPGIHDLFEVGKEIVTYESIEDLREKINYYLENENERKLIAEGGQIRAWKDHYYEKRLERLINLTLNSSDHVHDYLDYMKLA